MKLRFGVTKFATAGSALRWQELEPLCGTLVTKAGHTKNNNTPQNPNTMILSGGLLGSGSGPQTAAAAATEAAAEVRLRLRLQL